jgi:prepilin-type N-terminal cleavage/methylation domain-containing protein
MFSAPSFRYIGKGEIMGRMSTNSGRGFTLIELMVSLAVGMLVVGSAVQLFSLGLDATFVVSQRAEMQQDLRATSNLLLKDISLAGAGMPPGIAVALPSGTPKTSIYGCDQVGNCIPGGGLAYPCSTNVGPCVPTLYGIIPGWQLGITPPGSPVKSDVITVVYSDSLFALNCYAVTFPAGGAVNPVTFTAPVPTPPTCALPPGLVNPQAVNDPVVGLTTGDLILFTNTLGKSTGQAIAEVSNVSAGGNPYTVNFLDNDPLEFNQSGAAAGDLAQIIAGANTLATRIFVISYYLKLQPDPLGVGPGTPVLMRQVNGHLPVPVAENVVNLQFTYDTYDAAGNLLNAQGNAGYPGTSLNLIRKTNITHLTVRGQVAGGRSYLMTTNGYQSFDFQTSISARNLSYQNRYSFK